MSEIKLVIASDSDAIRENFQNQLVLQDDLKIINESIDLFQTKWMVDLLQPDILLMDSRLFSSEAKNNFLFSNSLTKTIIFGDFFSDDFIAENLQYGIQGFLLKPIHNRTLIKAIHVVFNGDVWIERERLVRIVKSLCKEKEHFDEVPLETPENITDREWDIIYGVSQGMTNKQIAKQLRISDKTIKAHLSHIFHKLHVSRRSQLAFYQLRNPKIGIY